MDTGDVIIRKAILHIMDSTKPEACCSKYLLNLTPDVSEFLGVNINRMYNGDDVKDCVFDEENSAFFKALYGFSEDDLTDFSIAAAQEYYNLMKHIASIPDGDLIFATCQIHSVMFLAILKVSYRTILVHRLVDEQDGPCHTIARMEGALPSASSKPAEAALINLSDYSLRMSEKKYDIDGKKDVYFSSQYLGCHGKISQKAKMDIVTKAIEKTNETYYEDNITQKLETKKILQQEIAETGSIDIKELPEKLYPGHTEAQEKFTEKLEKYHIDEEEIKPKMVQTSRKLSKQFLVTDTGIEINIPMEQYENEDSVQVLTAEDGTISVIIKNITHISAK